MNIFKIFSFLYEGVVLKHSYTHTYKSLKIFLILTNIRALAHIVVTHVHAYTKYLLYIHTHRYIAGDSK